MLFDENKQQVLYLEEKLPLGRKIMIGLLAVAIIGGGVNGYVSHKSVDGLELTPDPVLKKKMPIRSIQNARG